jgi:hypothetical protein
MLHPGVVGIQRKQDGVSLFRKENNVSLSMEFDWQNEPIPGFSRACVNAGFGLDFHKKQMVSVYFLAGKVN